MKIACKHGTPRILRCEKCIDESLAAKDGEIVELKEEITRLYGRLENESLDGTKVEQAVDDAAEARTERDNLREAMGRVKAIGLQGLSFF
jgi:hypothetical protein